MNWSWPAFLTGIWWFLYRKMYVEAGVVAFALVMSPVLPFIGTLGVWIAAGMFGPSAYFHFLEREARFRGVRIIGVNQWVVPVAILATILVSILFVAILFSTIDGY